MSSNFNNFSHAFLSSFKSQTGAVFHPDITITDLQSQYRGRGIVATADIPPDTTLFVVPRDYVISVENSTLSHLLPRLFSNDDGDDDEIIEDAEDAMIELPKPWLDLILVLIYEFLHRDTSKWKSYWDVLPEKFDTLMFWSDVEVAELQASTAREKIGKDHADQMFRRKILPVVNTHETVFYPEGVAPLTEGELLTLAHRMGSLIMAYAFDLENENGEDDEEGEDGWAEDREGKTAMGMVPMADMLNADAEFNAHLEHEESSLTMRSLREIKKGEEVLNYYGPLPNSDLLRRYGYTSAKHSRYDVVEIKWQSIKKAMAELLGSVPDTEVEGDEIEESFILERESGDPDETGINTTQAKFTTFPEELVEQVTMFLSASLKIKEKPNDDEKRRLKQMFLQVMIKTLSARVAEYGTTIEQDMELLQQESTTGRKKMAIDVRVGEKSVLREVEQLTRDLLQKYTDVQERETNSERPSKKQKTRR